MANVKITALPAAASLLTTDILPVVVDPGGTPVTEKATVAVLANTVGTALVGGKVVAMYTGPSGTFPPGASVLKYQTLIQDSGGGTPVYDKTTGLFTVPTGRGGLYQLFASVTMDTAVGASAAELYLEFLYNGTGKSMVDLRVPALTASVGIYGFRWYPLAAGDTIEFDLTLANFGSSPGADNFHGLSQMSIIGPW